MEVFQSDTGPLQPTDNPVKKAGKIYAGIGSRETPERVLGTIRDIGAYLAKRGYTLRSGAAKGADTAFEQGCDTLKGSKEIYLPWRSFNGHPSSLCTISSEAVVLAEKYHPKWDALSYAGRLLIARDVYQVLGLDFKTPVRFIVCWTPGGLMKGGTAQALRMANDLYIPVLNLGKENDHVRILQWMTLGLDFLEDISYNLFSTGK